MKRRPVICLILFIAAFAVRVVVWENNKIEMAGVQWVVTANYLADARALAAGDIQRFLGGDDPPQNARVIDHPPGYPLAIGVVSFIAGEGSWLVVQLVLNSFAPVLLFLIAMRLFDERTGILTGVLAALSPQLAYHSGLLLPDELSVIPVLAAMWFLVDALDATRMRNAILCGVSLGISCWLRSNALLLPVFVAVAAFAVLERSVRLRFAALVLVAFAVTIAPVTIRNAVYFHSFIPLSLGGGTTFVEGLGDIDNGTRGLPVTDENVMALDSRLDGGDGSYTTLYDPNGVERDTRRMAFGRSVVANDPLWFVAGVAKRGLSTFRVERVPAIAPERDEYETTPGVFYWPGRIVKVIQRSFATAVLLPLALLGFAILAYRKMCREFVILAAVPLYYATVQPLVHTEYRYVIATQHFLLVLVSFAVVWIVRKVATA